MKGKVIKIKEEKRYEFKIRANIHKWNDFTKGEKVKNLGLVV